MKFVFNDQHLLLQLRLLDISQISDALPFIQSLHHGSIYAFIMSEISLAPEITVRALRELRQSSSPPLLVDVREPWEVAAAGIQAAVCIPMGDIPSRAHAELDPDHPIVVVCHHGARSLSVTMWLRREGFEHVQSLAGGIDEWSRVIDPQVPRY